MVRSIIVLVSICCCLQVSALAYDNDYPTRLQAFMALRPDPEPLLQRMEGLAEDEDVSNSQLRNTAKLFYRALKMGAGYDPEDVRIDNFLAKLIEKRVFSEARIFAHMLYRHAQKSSTRNIEDVLPVIKGYQAIARSYEAGTWKECAEIPETEKMIELFETLQKEEGGRLKYKESLAPLYLRMGKHYKVLGSSGFVRKEKLSSYNVAEANLVLAEMMEIDAAENINELIRETQFLLAQIYGRLANDYTRSVAAYKRAGTRGHPRAQFILTDMLTQEDQLVEDAENDHSPFYWFERYFLNDEVTDEEKKEAKVSIARLYWDMNLVDECLDYLRPLVNEGFPNAIALARDYQIPIPVHVDEENAHRPEHIDSMRRSLRYLTETYAPVEGLTDTHLYAKMLTLLATHWRHIGGPAFLEAAKTLKLIFEDLTPEAIVGVNSLQTLHLAWAKILSHPEEEQAELKKRMVEELADSENRSATNCPQGRIQRLLNVFNGFDENIRIDMRSITENLGDRVSALKGVIERRIDSEGLRELVNKPRHDRTWEEQDDLEQFKNAVVMHIRNMLVEDFVLTARLTFEDLEKKWMQPINAHYQEYLEVDNAEDVQRIQEYFMDFYVGQGKVDGEKVLLNWMPVLSEIYPTVVAGASDEEEELEEEETGADGEEMHGAQVVFFNGQAVEEPEVLAEVGQVIAPVYAAGHLPLLPNSPQQNADQGGDHIIINMFDLPWPPEGWIGGVPVEVGAQNPWDQADGGEVVLPNINQLPGGVQNAWEADEEAWLGLGEFPIPPNYQALPPPPDISEDSGDDEEEEEVVYQVMSGQDLINKKEQ